MILEEKKEKGEEIRHEGEGRHRMELMTICQRLCLGSRRRQTMVPRAGTLLQAFSGC